MSSPLEGIWRALRTLLSNRETYTLTIQESDTGRMYAVEMEDAVLECGELVHGDPVDPELIIETASLSPVIDVLGLPIHDDQWAFCPNCGSQLTDPAGPYNEWSDCPECGRVHIEFYRGEASD